MNKTSSEEKSGAEELIWTLIEEEISKRAKRISETKKLEEGDIILFSIRSLKTDVENLSKRVNNTDERIDGLDKRIDGLGKRIDSLDKSINERIDSLNKSLNERINSNFKWMLGILIAMWVSIILAIVFAV